MNTISIKNNEQLEKVLRYKTDNFFRNFIFKEYRIKFKYYDEVWIIIVRDYDETKHNVKAKLIKNNESFEFEFDYLSNEERLEILTTPTGSMVDFAARCIKLKQKLQNDKKTLDDSTTWILDNCKLVLGVNEQLRKYVMNESLKREKIVRENKVNKSRKDSKNCRTSNDKKTETFLLDDIISYCSNEKTGIKHNMICQHWEVRGHYRHYKSGKVVWIEQYDKGKNRTVKVKNKKYVV